MTATVPTTESRRAPKPALAIRPLRREDGGLIEAVFDGLSDQSRYQRFHGPKPRLTGSDRAFLANVDQRDHLALVALDQGGQAIGIARAVRLHDDPAAAELAVSVIDARQHDGLGSELIRRLALRAAGAGIERLVARVLASSRLVRGLQRRGWRVVGRDGPALTLEVEAWQVACGAASRQAAHSGRVANGAA